MTPDTQLPRTKLTPDDPGYRAVVDRQFNKRFRASPDYVRPAATTAEVIDAVQDAVRERRRLAVTSGGHCLENFVSDADIRAIVDLSPMNRVYFDPTLGGVAVEAGATVGEAFRALHDNWGVTVPFGEYPGIGIGGHVVGGAFGFLCRELGLAADYLLAVEVVTVDAEARAQRVLATRDSTESLRDLWWAHTGGGGGNFGVVTTYWFRSPNAVGDDPRRLLPHAPDAITTFEAEWDWSDIHESEFVRLLQNHGRWCEQHSKAESSNATLWTLLEIHRSQFGKIITRGLSTAGAGAPRQIDEHLSELGAGTVAPRLRHTTRLTWLEFALNPFPELFAMPPGGVSAKVKDALLKRRLTDRQIRVAYDYLTSSDYDVIGGVLGFCHVRRARQRRLARSDCLARTRRDSRHGLQCGLDRFAGRRAEPGVGARLLS